MRRLLGLARSFLIYYGIPGRQRRLRAMYGQFLNSGDLAFDIGAHLGNRVKAISALGARVVAAEPHPDCLRVLRGLFGNDERVQIEPTAVGGAEGQTSLYICEGSPTLSTVSGSWIEHVRQSSMFEGIRWDRNVEVPVTTLDRLIERHGRPQFIKIDVEGHEPQVLEGLSQPVPALSFEFLPASRETALACIDRLEALGRYRFNYSMVETMRLASASWLDARDMRAALRAMPDNGRSGDVYAVLSDRFTDGRYSSPSSRVQ